MSASGALRMTFAQLNIAALDHQPFAVYKAIRQLCGGHCCRSAAPLCGPRPSAQQPAPCCRFSRSIRRMASYSSSVICTHSVVLSCGENSLNVGRPQILRHFLGLGIIIRDGDRHSRGCRKNGLRRGHGACSAHWDQTPAYRSGTPALPHRHCPAPPPIRRILASANRCLCAAANAAADQRIHTELCQQADSAP